MNMSERILTLHPDPAKRGVSISRAKYDMIRGAILHTLREKGEISFSELVEAVNDQVKDKFDGSVSWYVVSVKLDLEARDQIERVEQPGLQRIRLAADYQK
jgi:DNA-binding transcriptional ArsR family regulator